MNKDIEALLDDTCKVIEEYRELVEAGRMPVVYLEVIM